MLGVELVRPLFVNDGGGLVLVPVLILPCNPVEVVVVMGVGNLAFS